MYNACKEDFKSEAKIASTAIARVLIVADTHLGFDFPLRPRIKRRRRGHDFFANFKKALRPAIDGGIDIVIHGGDLLFRSKVPSAIVDMAMSPIIDVAERGVKVYIVPGNHERSQIPLQLWTVHKNIHIFHKPKTFICKIADSTIAIAGFPFVSRIRDMFSSLVSQTGYQETKADASLLCIHQTVEGAHVGPRNYTFRRGPEIVRGCDIPSGFAAILSGHIHRAQMLTQDLNSRPLDTPVIYPGSVERTSFAERNEEKQYVNMQIALSGVNKGKLVEVNFIQLPARPMVNIRLNTESQESESIIWDLKSRLSVIDPNAVVRIEMEGAISEDLWNELGAKKIREYAPPSMNISLAPFSVKSDKRRTIVYKNTFKKLP